MGSLLATAFLCLFSSLALARGGYCGKDCGTAFLTLFAGSAIVFSVAATCYYGLLAARYKGMQNFKDARTKTRSVLVLYSVLWLCLAIGILGFFTKYALLGSVAVAIAAPIIYFSARSIMR